MKVALPLAASSLLRKGAAQDDQTKTANYLTAWKECSASGGKEWSLCLQPMGRGALYYCPWDDSVDPITNPGPLANIDWYGAVATSFLPCMTCPQADPVHGDDCLSSIGRLQDAHNLTEYQYNESIAMCTALCESGQEGDGCSDENLCTVGSHFCDYSAEDELSGSCVECPDNISDCFEDNFLASQGAQVACSECRLYCDGVETSKVTVDGIDVPSFHVKDASHELALPVISGSGDLVDCSDLILRDVDICLGGKDRVCLVEDVTRDTSFWQLSEKAEQSGCVALIMYADRDPDGRHSHDNLAIPFVEIDYDQGNHLKDEKLGTMTYVETHVLGSACYHGSPWPACSAAVACEKNTYCDFGRVVEDGEYVEGWCQDCPTDYYGLPNPAGCFFGQSESGGHARTEQIVKSCVEVCNYKLELDGQTKTTNHLTASKECSPLGGKEWSLCLDYWDAYYYCPWDESVDPITNPEPLGFLQCMACPQVDPLYGYDCLSSIENLQDVHNLTEYQYNESIAMCTELCESGLEGDGCSDENLCMVGSHFCDYSAEDELSGSCVECPDNIDVCFEDGFLVSRSAQMACFECRLYCDGVETSELIVDGVGITSFQMYGASHELALSVIAGFGDLVDCSDLVLPDVDICLGGKDRVCLAEDFTKDTLYWQLSQKAEQSGCVALIMYRPDGDPGSHHSHDKLAIPFVEVYSGDGKHLRAEKLGTMTYVETHVLGSACYYGSPWPACSAVVTCEANTYCDFGRAVEDGEYVEGWCEDCPTDDNGLPDPAGCFFDRSESGGYVMTEQIVKSCADSCNYKLEFDGCKFCPNDVSGFEFGIEDGVEQCRFCPLNDVLYPERLVPLFGENITCWNMQAFFERLKVPKNSQNCELAQQYNYICGCEGTGYGGASSQAKKAALVWLPRCMALPSLLGSMFIAYDTTKNREKREKVTNQILCILSIFDVFGSVAIALTSLPIPETDYFYGSLGTTKTCTAQGFFIQIGTIACFLNVSLAICYLLIVKYEWSEASLKKKRAFLIAPPILVGLTFACAGIQFYDNMILWCNNSARWWPEIPVIISIAVATGIMISMCHDVYKTDSASAQYTAGNLDMTWKVTKQAFWFTGAFYITWVPYLALQYMWSSGKAFTHYGFILFAGSLVPLQGFWNFLVYIRPRYFIMAGDAISQRFSSAVARFTISTTQETTGQSRSSTQQQTATMNNCQNDNRNR